MAILDGHSGPVQRLVFSPDGSQLVSLSKDRTAKIWSVSAAAARHSLVPNAPECSYISFEGASRMRATGFANKTGSGNIIRYGTAWKTWSLETLQLVGSGVENRTEDESPPNHGPSTERYRAIIPYGKPTVLVTTSKREPVATLVGHSGNVWSGRISPDNRSVVTASSDGTARIWDLQGRTLHVLAHDGVEVKVAEYTPDGKLIATGDGDGRLRLWNSTTGQLRTTINAHRQEISKIQFSPDGTRMLTISGQGRTVKAWKMPEATLLYQLVVDVGSESSVIQARFSDDGLLLVITARKRTIEIWDAWTGSPVFVAEFPADVVWDAAFTPDRKNIAATGENGEVLLFPFEYEPRTADVIAKLVQTRTAFRLSGGRLLSVN